MKDQAQAVYAAEDLWSAKCFASQARFGDWHEVQAFYVKLAATLRERGDADVYPPTVVKRKGSLKAHYDPITKSVHIPPYDKGGSWALTVATAAHEFAHHLAPHDDHGVDYREAMLMVVEALNMDPEPLRAAYEEVGLSNGDKPNMTDKVRKLLLHADKAATDEEQKTYLAKAEGLAAEYSINLAILRKKQADKGGDRDRPTTGKMFSLTALPNVTYRNLAVTLGGAIGRAHGCQSTIRGKSEWVTFYGFQEDIDLTELMLTRITPMMFEASDAYLKSPQHKLSGTHGTSARISFCESFAYEIEHRLREAVKETVERMSAEPLAIGGETSTALVLANKVVEVADYVAYEFKRQGVRGSWRGSSTSRWSASASNAGHSAAQSANIFGRKALS